MKDLTTREQFIELRANNDSYQTIADKLSVSKTTLMQLAKEYQVDIANMRSLALDALQEQYGVSKRERITMLGEQLQAVREELKQRGLSDVPTFRLMEMLTRLTDYLIKEETAVTFLKQHEGLRMFEPHNDIETWDG